MKDHELLAGRSLRSKGYDVESVGGVNSKEKHRASRFVFVSKWCPTKVELLKAVVEFEKSATFGKGA